MKILSLLIITLTLTSCFGGDDTNVALTEQKGTGYTVNVPKTWIAVDAKSLPNPKNGTIGLAMTSPDISNGFANNLLILKDTLGPDADPKMTSRKYMVVSQALTSGTYTEYTKLSDTTVKWADGDEGTLQVFEAKYNPETPKQKFIQTAKLCGKDVYLMTIGLALSITDTQKYNAIFESFTCSK